VAEIDRKTNGNENRERRLKFMGNNAGRKEKNVKKNTAATFSWHSYAICPTKLPSTPLIFI